MKSCHPSIIKNHLKDSLLYALPRLLKVVIVVSTVVVVAVVISCCVVFEKVHTKTINDVGLMMFSVSLFVIGS